MDLKEFRYKLRFDTRDFMTKCEECIIVIQAPYQLAAETILTSYLHNEPIPKHLKHFPIRIETCK